ncbi:MAG: nucleotide exchange factor GrpE [Rhodospirillales bacterium]|nr:nucleotide exchange factor GrpE [Rhodospirillales bacterium]MCB9995185.1 nucleotide exchange factor GrpE [Rhodospirillales bacterium]
MNDQNSNPNTPDDDFSGTPEQEQAPAQDPLAPEPEATHTEDPVEAENDLEAKVDALQAELSEARDQMLRAMAEAENTRKRLLRDREDVRKYAVSDFAKDLLDFADNFRRALDSLPEDIHQVDERIAGVISGIEAMEKELLKNFEKHGITKMEPLDQLFDPNFHEVMFEAPGTGKPAGTIIQLIEPGYMLHDRLLKPARVGVAKDEGQGGPQHQVDTEA